jgi:hypothetical protein
VQAVQAAQAVQTVQVVQTVQTVQGPWCLEGRRTHDALGEPVQLMEGGLTPPLQLLAKTKSAEQCLR